jgi:hypothetical protein
LQQQFAVSRRSPVEIVATMGSYLTRTQAAQSPEGGYAGQVLAVLRQQTGQPWRVLNLSVSGSLTRDVTGVQLARSPPGLTW